MSHTAMTEAGVGFTVEPNHDQVVLTVSMAHNGHVLPVPLTLEEAIELGLALVHEGIAGLHAMGEV